MHAGERIAIVGLGGLFPGAADLDQFWRNIAARHDASREVPEGRWCLPPEIAFDPRPATPDRVVSTRGYFLDPFEPDLTGLEIDPELVAELDVLFHLALHVGNRAFRSARMETVDRARVGVILGSIALPTELVSERVRQIVAGKTPTVHPLNRDVTGLPAVLLAQALGLKGPAFTLDAACASSLYAIKLACDELHAGRADAMLAGGLSRPDCLYTQMGFSQLRALSPSGRCSPFDASADGLVVGEGGGIFVLKRLSDAIAHGDTIHGVIAGVGLSNDIEGNLLAPASEGQLRAMRAAYRMAGWRPQDVDMFECHATGTPVGDRTEFESLCQLWGEERELPIRYIGSVKSNVGHLLTGANAAGLMKVLLAMRHRTFPPSANFENGAFEVAGTNFGILDEKCAWPSRPDGAPRRAAISGFGFGGINAHLLVEEFDPVHEVEPSERSSQPDEPLAIVAIGGRHDDWFSNVRVPAGAFPIPPREMAEMLPQQLMMLVAAREALTECRLSDPSRVGVFIGVHLDFRTTLFNLRWWSSENGYSPDAASPPLTADRTMGALASIAASRIARTFKLGGPCFTLSDEAGYGRAAWEVACSQLRRGDVDCAIVGEVHFADVVDDETLPVEGAMALVVKRLADAERDGDRIRGIVLENAHTILRRDRFTPPRWLGAIGGGCRVLVNRKNPDESAQYWLYDRAVGRREAHAIGKDRFGDSIDQPILEGTFRSNERFYRLRHYGVFLFVARTVEELEGELNRFASLVLTAGELFNSDDIARAWWRRSSPPARGPHRIALVVDSPAQLVEFARDPLTAIKAALVGEPTNFTALRVGYCEESVAGKLAFVYPGSGNHFYKMGRELGMSFPDVLDRQQEESDWLRSQYAADEIWCDSNARLHPRTALFAQVSIGTLVTDLLRSFGVEPDAAIGYSLGESASLFGLRVWTDRDGMLNRLKESSLFASDLAAPYNSARVQWGWKSNEPIDWVTGVLAASAAEVEREIPHGSKVYVLIINTPEECVIGGHRPHVQSVVSRLGRVLIEVNGVTAAHCEVAEPVREAYRALHHLPTTPLPNVKFYSGAWGETYEPTSDRAADAITAAVLHRIDFPKVIEAAYRDGVRTFIEIGPGNSCCRIIDANLKDRPHVCLPVLVRHESELSNLFTVLAYLHMSGKSIDLAPLYGCDDDVNHVAETNYLSFPTRPHPPKLVPTEPVIASAELVADVPIFFDETARIQTAAGAAHEAFLRFSTNTQQRFAETVALQTEILKQWVQEPHDVPVGVPRALSNEQCFEFAAGSIGNVLGPEFAEADSFPTRVRLPDGPLMLVDRILQIDGEPRSMTSGRVVTDHYVHADRWYLDAGRIPVCVAVEAGQADLFLSGFLGIDFITRGHAVYRLLDAAITFHGPLPGIGETITYDIHIDRFFRQGDTHLFRFRFEGTVNGRPLLTMTDGCAGFFTQEELDSGKGIVQTELDRRPMPGKRPADWQPLAPMRRETFSSEQVDALRIGDLATVFGSAFAALPLQNPQRLPGGMLKLVDRVVHLDPEGGRYGLGVIRAEADIHSDDWFLTCHFVDDMVMPGTLMYECCLHTLRIYLMRMGWIGEEGEVACEPIPGVASKLKCRGQVIASTRTAAYEVVIKEIGYGPEPYALADALMYADGRPIVEMTNMSLRLTGLSRDKVESLWRAGPRQGPEFSIPLFDRDRITAFAIGNPSDAFGELYKVFDRERIIARLPGPPFQFLDRIVQIDAKPWKMVAGGEIVAEYDVPPDEWYFAAQRSPMMPFSVLLEIALQPCGWLAAYVGSALTSPIDLSFRNLGGRAIQHRPVGPDVGTLTTTVKLTRVSSSGGMIIQHYDYAVRCNGEDVYTGDTYFGFFSKEALANQVGLKDCPLYQPTADELGRAWTGRYPTDRPFPDTMLRMVDDIKYSIADGGPHGLGAIEGRIRVDPAAWFFKAHFHQDPVWPGSLGLESFVQLLKFAAAERWGVSPGEVTIPANGREHKWVYRGQVIPTDREVTVQAWMKQRDDANRSLVADGLLSVDGRIIYQMTDFAVQG